MGTKRFITNAHMRCVHVMARTNPELKGAAAISAFIVDVANYQVFHCKRDKKMGQKGAHTCDVIFENCRILHQL